MAHECPECDRICNCGSDQAEEVTNNPLAVHQCDCCPRLPPKHIDEDGEGPEDPSHPCADCGEPAQTFDGRNHLCHRCDDDPAAGYLARMARIKSQPEHRTTTPQAEKLPEPKKRPRELRPGPPPAPPKTAKPSLSPEEKAARRRGQKRDYYHRKKRAEMRPEVVDRMRRTDREYYHRRKAKEAEKIRENARNWARANSHKRVQPSEESCRKALHRAMQWAARNSEAAQRHKRRYLENNRAKINARRRVNDRARRKRAAEEKQQRKQQA